MFTGLLSVAFLGQKLRYYSWIGIGFVIVGLFVVGISDFMTDNLENYDMNGIITGQLGYLRRLFLLYIVTRCCFIC